MNSKTSIISLWVEGTLQLLVDFPDEVKVEFVQGGACSIISCKVAKEDLGKVIGRQGIMADALRTFVSAYAGKYKTRYVLNIET